MIITELIDELHNLYRQHGNLPVEHVNSCMSYGIDFNEPDVDLNHDGTAVHIGWG